MHAIKRFFGMVPASADEAEEMRQAIEAERLASVEREREKRIHKRVNMQVAVSGVGEDNFFLGFSEDISEGGVFVSTLCPPARGEIIDLSIAVSGEQALTIKGEVRWHRSNQRGEPTGCGVCFLPMSPEQSRLLAAALDGSGRDPLFYDA